MKPSDYKEQVYRLGIPIRVREVEAEMQAYQRDYPDLFLSDTPIQLLRPAMKNGASSNGTSQVSHTPHPSGGYSRAVQRKRENSAALLAWIERGKDHSRTLEAMRVRGTDMRGIHQLVRHGYLLRRGNKMVRTEKAYAVLMRAAAAPEPHVTKKKFYSKAGKAKREQSAALIASFDTETPSAPPTKFKRAMGSLVRRGYLVQAGKGLYVRTEKQYVV